eukprot:g3041.t1
MSHRRDEDELYFQLLMNYVPKSVVAMLADHRVPDPTSISNLPIVFEEVTCVLVLQLYGLDELSERLAMKENRGVLFFQYHESLLMCIEEEGGDLLKEHEQFLICTWSSQESDAKTAVRLALQCASKMLSSIHKLNKEEGDELVSARCGIGFGNLGFMHFGGFEPVKENDWQVEYLGIGEGMIVAFSALRNSDMDEIVVHPGAWEKLENSCFRATSRKNDFQVVDFRSGMLEKYEYDGKAAFNPLSLSKSAEQDDELQTKLTFYIPGNVSSHLSLDDMALELWVSDHRMLTVLHVDLGLEKKHFIGAVQTDNACRQIFQKGMRIVQATIAQFDGLVYNVSMDDTSMTISVVFGAAPRVHLDDPIRGVLSGLLLCAKANRETGLSASVGISSGMCFAGVVGSFACRSFQVYGKSVGIAGMLMTQAMGRGGGVICDGTTRDKIGEMLAFEEIPLIKKNNLMLSKPTSRSRSASHTMSIRDKVSAFLCIEKEMSPLSAMQRFENQLKKLHKYRRLQHHTPEWKQHLKKSKVGNQLVRTFSEWDLKDGKVVILEGALGSGKTSLLSHCLGANVLQGGDYNICMTYADPYEEILPFGAIGNLIKEWLVQKFGNDNEIKMIYKVKAMLANYEGIQNWVGLLKKLLELPFEMSQEAKMLYKKDNENHIQFAQRCMLLALLWEIGNEKPAIISIDNAIHLDVMSWALLHDMLSGGEKLSSDYSSFPPNCNHFLKYHVGERKKCKMLICLGLRPLEKYFEQLDPQIEPARDLLCSMKEKVKVLKIERLSNEEVKEALFYHLKPTLIVDIAPSTLNIIVDLCDGNALFVREVAYALKASQPSLLNYTRVGDNESKKHFKIELIPRFKAVRDIPLPPILNLMLGAEVDTVDLCGRVLMKLLVVIGRPSTRKTLFDSFPVEHQKDDLFHQLQNLIDRGILKETGKKKRIFFVSPFYFQTIQSRIQETHRKSLKGSIRIGSISKSEVNDGENDSIGTEWGGEWAAESNFRKSILARNLRKASILESNKTARSNRRSLYGSITTSQDLLGLNPASKVKAEAAAKSLAVGGLPEQEVMTKDDCVVDLQYKASLNGPITTDLGTDWTAEHLFHAQRVHEETAGKTIDVPYLDLLCSYIPQAVVRNMVEMREKHMSLNVPRVEIDTAALLLVDMKPFLLRMYDVVNNSYMPTTTDHTTQHYHDTKATEVLFETYSMLYGCIARACAMEGGDIVSITNNTISAVWLCKKDKVDLKEQTRRAVQCGVHVLSSVDEMIKFEGSTGNLLFSDFSEEMMLKSGIGCGTFSLLHMGGVNNHNCIVATGNAYDQAFTAASVAEPSEVALSPETWFQVGGDDAPFICIRDCTEVNPTNEQDKRSVKAIDRRFGATAYLEAKPLQSLNVSKLKAERKEEIEIEVGKYILSPVSCAFSESHKNRELWLNEKRYITYVRVNPGLSRSSVAFAGEGNNLLQKFHEIITEVQRNVNNYGGDLISVNNEDSDFVLVAAFGVTVAHTDDCVRACLCAIELVKVLIDRKLCDDRISVGISTGFFGVGIVGTKCHRKAFTVQGENVMLVNALEWHAEDKNYVICADAATYKEIDGVLDMYKAEDVQNPLIFKESAKQAYRFSSGKGVKILDSDLVWNREAVQKKMSKDTHSHVKSMFKTQFSSYWASKSVILAEHASMKSLATSKKLCRAFREVPKLTKAKAIILEGPLGSGKTTVLGHCLAVTKIPFSQSHSPRFHVHNSFSSIGNLLSAILGKSRDPSKVEKEAVKKQMIKLLEKYPNLEKYKSILNSCMSLDFPITKETKKIMKNTNLRLVTIRCLLLALLRLCASDSSTNKLWIIDDALWTDDMSLRVLRDFMNGGVDIGKTYDCFPDAVATYLTKQLPDENLRSLLKPRVLICLSTLNLELNSHLVDNEHSISAFSHFCEEANVSKLSIDPLTDVELHECITHTLKPIPVFEISDDVMSLVQMASGGVAKFAIDSVEALRLSPSLPPLLNYESIDGNTYGVTRALRCNLKVDFSIENDLPCPPEIARYVNMLLDVHGLNEKVLMRTAACAGINTGFKLETLVAAYPFQSLISRIKYELDELVDLGFLKDVGENMYTFSSPLFPMVLLESTVASQRKILKKKWDIANRKV